MEHLATHTDSQTWHLVRPEDASNVIKGKWVYKVKVNADGTIERFKARWVAKGFTQKKGVDYTEFFSPAARGGSLRSIIAIGNQIGSEIDSFDVTNAFPQARVVEDIYVEQPRGHEVYDLDGVRLICKLDKALYGLMQAARNWNQLVTKFMRSLGYIQSMTDVCIFHKYLADGSVMYVAICR
jgi:hypothetical protein